MCTCNTKEHQEPMCRFISQWPFSKNVLGILPKEHTLLPDHQTNLPFETF